MYKRLYAERENVRKEFERLSVSGNDALMRSKGIEALVLTKVLRSIRTDKYEQD